MPCWTRGWCSPQSQPLSDKRGGAIHSAFFAEHERNFGLAPTHISVGVGLYESTLSPRGRSYESHSCALLTYIEVYYFYSSWQDRKRHVFGNRRCAVGEFGRRPSGNASAIGVHTYGIAGGNPRRIANRLGVGEGRKRLS